MNSRPVSSATKLQSRGPPTPHTFQRQPSQPHTCATIIKAVLQLQLVAISWLTTETNDIGRVGYRSMELNTEHGGGVKSRESRSWRLSSSSFGCVGKLRAYYVQNRSHPFTEIKNCFHCTWLTPHRITGPTRSKIGGRLTESPIRYSRTATGIVSDTFFRTWNTVLHHLPN